MPVSVCGEMAGNPRLVPLLLGLGLLLLLPPEVPVLAVGGVTPENLESWVEAGCAGAGLGSDLYRAGQAVERTRQQAERFIAAARSG